MDVNLAKICTEQFATWAINAALLFVSAMAIKAFRLWTLKRRPELMEAVQIAAEITPNTNEDMQSCIHKSIDDALPVVRKVFIKFVVWTIVFASPIFGVLGWYFFTQFSALRALLAIPDPVNRQDVADLFIQAVWCSIPALCIGFLAYFIYDIAASVFRSLDAITRDLHSKYATGEDQQSTDKSIDQRP